MSRFRLAVSYRDREDKTKRPPLPGWLDPERIVHWARGSVRISFQYWSKIYWSTPPWLNEEQIAEMKVIHETCPEGYHVDHVVPLKSKLVCGLNVPWNLQHLTEADNYRKSNKYWPDHPDENEELFDLKFTPYQMRLL